VLGYSAMKAGVAYLAVALSEFARTPHPRELPEEIRSATRAPPQYVDPARRHRACSAFRSHFDAVTLLDLFDQVVLNRDAVPPGSARRR
jgi:hypothetical protein